MLVFKVIKHGGLQTFESTLAQVYNMKEKNMLPLVKTETTKETSLTPLTQPNLKIIEAKVVLMYTFRETDFIFCLSLEGCMLEVR